MPNQDLPLIAELCTAVGAAHVLRDGDLVAYERDWRKRWHGRALAVVRPGSTAEVAAVMRLCARHGVAVVPQGGAFARRGCRHRARRPSRPTKPRAARLR